MPGTELFTIIAMVEARDRASAIINRMEKAFLSLSDSVDKTAEDVRVAGEAMDSSLLRSASGTDDLELGIARLAAARADLTKVSREQATAELDLLAVQERVAGYALQGAEAEEALVTALRRLDVAARNTAKAEMYLADAQKAQSDAAAAAAAKSDVAAASMGRTTKAAGVGLLGINKWGKAAMYGGAAAAFIGYEAVKTASSFETLTTRLVTSANESSSNLEMIRKGILEVSAQTGTSANDLAKSMYVVESAGYHGAAGLTVLKAATEGAQQEGANFADVANGVTDVLVDYHRKSSEAANVTSQLVKAVSYGKSNFQTFSKALSNVLPLASAMHLKLEDVTGVLATMTAHGMTAARSSFNIANAMRSLEAPTDAMKKEFKAVGISAQDVSAHLSKAGLAGTMQWLSGIAHKNAAALGQTYPGALRALMGTATGLQVALLTTGKNADDTNRAIKGIAGATADAKGNVEGYAKTQQTIAYQMGKFKAGLVAAGIAIGQALIPALVKVMGVLNQFLIPVMHFIERHKTMAAIIIGVAVGLGILAGVIAILNGVIAVMNVILDANPFVLIALAVIALVVAIIYAWNHWKTFHNVVMAVFNGVKTGAIAFWHALQAVWNAVAFGAEWLWGKMKAAWDMISGAATSLWHWLTSVWNAISSVTSAVWGAIAGFFKKWWPLLLVIFMPFVAILVSLWNHFHKQVWDKVKEAWTQIVKFLKAAWDEIKSLALGTWHLIYKYVVQPVEAIWAYLKQIWNAVKPYLSSAWHTIAGYANDAWQLVKKYIINPVKELWSYLTQKFDDIKSYVGKKLQGAVTDVENIAKGFYNVGKDIVMGMIHGIENSAGALFSSLKNLANNALKSAKSFLGIGSPSKLFSNEVGKWISHGIADGVLTHAGVAGEAVRKVASGLPGALPAGGTASMLGAGLGGYTGGLVGSGGGGTVVIDIHDNHIMNDRDLDDLVNKVGRRVATLILPAGGVKIRM